MKKITPDQFFAQYPKYSNFNELIKADILVMPSYSDHGFYRFTRSYYEFREVSAKYGINCLFYSEDQNRVNVYRELSEPPAVAFVFDYDTILSTAGFLLTLYEIFKDKVGDRKFRLKQVVRENNNYYETTFEGNIEQYKVMIEEMKFQVEQDSKK